MPAILLVLLFALHGPVMGSTSARETPQGAAKPASAGAALLLAKKDPANLVVVLEVSGKYTIFPASLIGDVHKNSVTLNADVTDAFVADVSQTGYGPEQKVAEWLFDQWLTWRKEGAFRRADRYLAFAEGKVLAGELDRLREDRILDVKRVLLVRKPQ